MENETMTIPDYPRGITFEQVWAALKKSEENFELQMKKSREEYDLHRKKFEEDFELQRKKSEEDRKKSEEDFNRRWEKIERISKRNEKQMGDLHRRFGQLAEHLVAPNIHKRFNEKGYHFGGVLPGGMKIFDEQGKTITEIDLLLENGETLMAVEVKVKPAVKDVEHHIKRLEILRDHRRKINDKRKVKGAIAGAIFGTEEKKATVEAGLYVIEQSGDTMKIDVPDDFVPREW